MSARSVSLVSFGSVASTGNTSVTVPVPSDAQSVEFTLGAVYAAVAGTSGTTFSFQYSVDGTTFSGTGAAKSVVVKNGAGVRIDGTQLITVRNALKTNGSNPILYIKVTITNADTTNAVSTAVMAQFHSGLE